MRGSEGQATQSIEQFRGKVRERKKALNSTTESLKPCIPDISIEFLLADRDAMYILISM